MSFDERRYIEAIPPQLFDEMISEYEATLPPKNHHKPTARTVKQIALQLADRQKYSPLHRQDCTQGSVIQCERGRRSQRSLGKIKKPLFQ